MSQFKSAKDILNSFQYSDTQQKAQKHVKHEFQDYAYRLAAELGDLDHRQIYMRLAKNVDRIMLEQAAAFAMDYNKERNKGKIFMWRLAQLREESLMRAQKKNFAQEFILKKMSELQDELPEIFRTKERTDAEAVTPALMPAILGSGLGAGEIHSPKKTKAANMYLLGCGTGLLAKQFILHDVKLHGSDLSAKAIAAVKKAVPDGKFVRKVDFREQKLKQNFFDWVILPNFWNLINIESELNYLQSFNSLLKKSGFLAFTFEQSPESKQEWLEFEWKEKKYLRFSKQNEKEELLTKVRKSGFTIFGEFDLGKTLLVIAEKI